MPDNLPKKCGDLGMFTLPCKISKKKRKNVMVDVGVSMNFMHASNFY